jgi:fructose-1,6-bisphosphatase/inositol monophosphatase family enzyme
VQQKTAHNDLVTETDKNIESLFHQAIKQKYPDHHFIGEESNNGHIEFDERPVWIIDPVDGTTNFVHTFPFCCISIAFCIDKIVSCS